MTTDFSQKREKGYESFFGFSEAPFSLAPNTRFLFESASHGAALTQVAYALERREPLVVVTGEIGSGKTLLCRTVVERLERKTFLSIINDPLLERDELLKQMLQDFGVISKDRTRMTPTSRHDLTHALQEFLLTLAPLQAHAVLIIDEAQHVQPDVLEQIRLVSNIQDERGTMLQIILVGQPDLEALLSRPELYQLKQRVSRHVRLESLSVSEVAQYIEHRLTVGSERHWRSQTPGAEELERALAEWENPEGREEMARGVTFTSEAVNAVARLSRGLPRVINLLCDRALEAACAQQAQTVNISFVKAAAQALDLSDVPDPAARGDLSGQSEEAASAAFVTRTPWSPRARRRLMLAASIAVALAAFWFVGRTVQAPRSVEAPSRVTTPPETSAATARTTPSPSPQAAAATQAPATATPAPASGSPSATPPPTTPAGSAAPATQPSGEGFEIVVASFRTEGRAAAVAGEIKALGLPVRQRVSSGWQQVLAGPFASRALAEEAEARVDRAGFTGTQIVPAAR